LELSGPLRDGDIDGFRAHAEAVVTEQFPGSNILLLREDGQQLMNTLLPPGASLPVRPNLETVHAVFATGQPAVSNTYVGAVARRYVVSIDVPVRQADGSIAYVLSVNPQINGFAETIRRQNFPNSWVISIFDRQGVNVARNLSPERFVGQKAGPGLLERMLTKPEGVFVNTSREGIELVTAFSRPVGQWRWAYPLQN
jgi:hypothetical protein